MDNLLYFIQIKTNIKDEDIISELLIGSSMTNLETKYEKDSAVINVYISENPGECFQQVNILLNDPGSRELLSEIPSVSLQTTRNADWNAEWKKHYKPIHIGKQMVIVPDFMEYSQSDNEIIIRIIPEMAFGTGYHPTTEFCLKSMDEIDLQNKTVADFGAGSGILSISAIKLGAKLAYMVEYDELAFDNCKNNIKLNGCLEKAVLLEGSIFDIKLNISDIIKSSDIIFVNILFNVLIEFFKIYSPLLKEKIIVLSGILSDEIDELISAAKKYCPDKKFKSESIKEWGGVIIF